MKTIFTILVLSVITSAFASPQGVALEEQMARRAGGHDNKSAQATLSAVFRLATPQGQVISLQERNANLMVRPASTMKLFTGWMALQRGVRSDEFLSEMLHTSDNAKAEQSLRLLGGASAMTRYYRDAGLPMAQLRIVDGSGLSKSNRTNCHVQLELLNLIRQTPDYERFRSLLASPGEVGTLDDRLLEYQGRLFGKTGTLSTTIALTGYLESPKGTLMFCVISEFFKNSWPAERARVDAVIRAKITELETSRYY